MREAFIYLLPIPIRLSVCPRVFLSLTFRTQVPYFKGQGGFYRHPGAAAPQVGQTSGFTPAQSWWPCQWPKWKVRSKDRNGAKALSETKGKRKKERKWIQGEDGNMERSGPSLRSCRLGYKAEKVNSARSLHGPSSRPSCGRTRGRPVRVYTQPSKSLPENVIPLVLLH